MCDLISKVRTTPWYNNPKDRNQHYAARYIDYLEAAVVSADGELRCSIVEELKEASADSLFKKVLLAT
jgi:hypothetical protein